MTCLVIACTDSSMPNTATLDQLTPLSSPVEPPAYQSSTPKPLLSPTSTLALPSATSYPTVTQTSTSIPSPNSTSTHEVVRFAVIGDYGAGGQAEQDVANLVERRNPDFILTVGDNNYPDGAAETIDWRIGAFYHDYIYPYKGALGEGADRNRFFPTLGNHDWIADQAQAYLDYFTLPGNERYYDFIWGPVQFFALDSDYREPGGVTITSRQALWLQTGLAESKSIWKIVFMHHPPFTSGKRGPVEWLRWPFREWGASAVLSGHDHFYERLSIDGFPYFINGLGGGGIYDFGQITAGSQVRYNADYGAMLVVADPRQITFQFINRSNEVIDTYQIVR
jgi:tartrate-resistant acid phosphatase type 5